VRTAKPLPTKNVTYAHTTSELGVAFQCPYCFEWLHFKEVSGNKHPDLNDEEAERRHAVEINIYLLVQIVE
jgi:hypothetical protein